MEEIVNEITENKLPTIREVMGVIAEQRYIGIHARRIASKRVFTPPIISFSQIASWYENTFDARPSELDGLIIVQIRKAIENGTIVGVLGGFTLIR